MQLHIAIAHKTGRCLIHVSSSHVGINTREMYVDEEGGRQGRRTGGKHRETATLSRHNPLLLPADTRLMVVPGGGGSLMTSTSVRNLNDDHILTSSGLLTVSIKHYEWALIHIQRVITQRRQSIFSENKCR